MVPGDVARRHHAGSGRAEGKRGGRRRDAGETEGGPEGGPEGETEGGRGRPGKKKSAHGGLLNSCDLNALKAIAM